MSGLPPLRSVCRHTVQSVGFHSSGFDLCKAVDREARDLVVASSSGGSKALEVAISSGGSVKSRHPMVS